MRPAHLIALLVMNVLWAGSYSCFKALSGRMTAGEIVTWRYTLAALLLAALWPLLPGRAPRGRRELLRAAIMGLLVFTAGPRLQVLGVHLGNAGDSSVVIGLEPLVTAVAAALFLREHVPARRWVGFALGLTGIILLNGAWHLDLKTASLWANLVFLSSFVCESAYSVVGKPLLQHCSPIKLIASSLFWGAGLNVLLDGRAALTRAPALTATDWANLAFLVLVCTLLGYTLWYLVIRECDVNLAALTILVQPIFGVLAAAWFLGEALHWGQLWGTLVVLTGLVLGFKRPEPPAPDVPAPAL